MRQTLFALIGCLLFSGTVLANTPPEVTNVIARQIPRLAVIELTYDITDADGDPVTVTLWYSTDGGATWDNECVTVSGDVGPGIMPGVGLIGTWDAGVDYPGSIDNEFSVRVHVDDGYVPPVILSTPIVFQSDRDGDLEIFTWDGTDLTQLTSNAATDGAPDWLTGSIVYHSNLSGDYDIWTMDQDGGSPTNLTNSTGVYEMGPKWSTDGTQIVYLQWTPGGSDIYMMNADGSGQVQLTSDPADDSAPAWSPDGSQIAFHSLRDGNKEVYVLNVVDLSVTRLTFDATMDDGSPTWSPDGSQIAFSKYLSGGEGEIWVMDAEGSNPRALTTAAGSQDYGPEWSYDGTQIAFERRTDLPSGPADIWLTTPDGAVPAAVVTDPANDSGVAWQKMEIWDIPEGFALMPPPSVSMPATFTMGSTVNADETPHQVTLTARFTIAAKEVTNAQYVEALQWALDSYPPWPANCLIYVNDGAVCDWMYLSATELLHLNNPLCEISYSDGLFSTSFPDRPVTCLSWYGAAAYCDWLNIQEGYSLSYSHGGNWECNNHNPYDAEGYRLPTEAEWEYSCRAGTTTEFNTGSCLDSDTEANYDGGDPYTGCAVGSYLGRSQDVGAYPANDWGIYDMHGNVWEYCNDVFMLAAYQGDETDPVGPLPGGSSDYVVRGGSWYLPATSCRSAVRGMSMDSVGLSGVRTGFRTARSMP